MGGARDFSSLVQHKTIIQLNYVDLVCLCKYVNKGPSKYVTLSSSKRVLRRPEVTRIKEGKHTKNSNKGACTFVWLHHHKNEASG